MCSNIPLVEKYRPTEFEDIVLDDVSSVIFINMIKTNTIPNLLFYGPPGTGKTTTAINLVKLYQQTYGKTSHSVMHLNASDDRGIDVIRNQIYTFVSSNSLFEHGLKFIILDEADYMTKPAQFALRSIIHTYQYSVRICMICNYISKIDPGVLSDFVIFRFNTLPSERVFSLLSNIVAKENISIGEDALRNIQALYKSDIRSMINCVQTYQFCTKDIPIVTEDLITYIVNLMKDKHPIPSIVESVMSTAHDPKYVIGCIFEHIIRSRDITITPEILDIMATSIHFPDCPVDCFVNYTMSQLYDKI
jgi:replication factor C subunit 3/5